MRLKLFVYSLLWLLGSTTAVFAVEHSQTDIGMVSISGGVNAFDPVFPRARAVTQTAALSSSSQLAFNNLLLAAASTTKADAQQTNKTTKTTKSTKTQSKTETFASLDEQAERLLKEVLNLSSDLSILDEQHTNPAKNQLLVLVTLEPSKFFELDYVELKVDDQVVAAHPYSDKEIGAMLRGGGHRLYLANLPAGMHHLKAVFVGKVPRDPDYQREASFTFISGVDRTVIELYVNSAENSGFPQFTIREFN